MLPLLISSDGQEHQLQIDNLVPVLPVAKIKALSDDTTIPSNVGVASSSFQTPEEKRQVQGNLNMHSEGISTKKSGETLTAKAE